MSNPSQYANVYDSEHQTYHIDPDASVLANNTTSTYTKTTTTQTVTIMNGGDGTSLDDVNMIHDSDGTISHRVPSRSDSLSTEEEDLYYPQFEDAPTSILIGSAVIFFLFLTMFTQINLRIHCNETSYMSMMTAAMYTGSYTLLSFVYCLLRWYRYPKHQQRYDRFYNQGQISLVSKCHRIMSTIYHISLTVIHTAFFLAFLVLAISTRRVDLADPLYGGTQTNWVVIIILVIAIALFWPAVIFIKVGVIIRSINRLKYARDQTNSQNIEISNYEDVA